MKTLLRIDCSPRSQGSHSRALADHFVKSWKVRNPFGIVKQRDLAKEDIPHIDQETITGFHTSTNEMTAVLKESVKISDALINEIKSATEILISSPLYNLNVPSNLKAYFDQVVRSGETFQFTEKGPEGLLTDKVAYLITVKGGTYKGTPLEQFDFQEPYLKAILGYIGIRVKNSFSLEGTSDQETLKINQELVLDSITKEFLN